MNRLTCKLFYYFITFFIIVTATFFLSRAIPGDPFMQEQLLPKEILEALRTHYGLNRPLLEQYGKYLQSCFFLDLGPSFIFKGLTVNQVIWQSFPISAVLGLEALFFALFGGIALGCLAARYSGKWQDKSIKSMAILGISIPSFIIATLLQYVLAIQLHLLPIARWGSFFHTILPALSLACVPMAFIVRLTRAQVLDVLQQDYIKTAKAKGLSPLKIVCRHVLRNSAIPILSYSGPLAVNILTGSFIIEKIYGIPGLGHWFVTSIINRDYTFIMGLTVFYTFILLTFIFLTDILIEIIDPRIRQLNYAN